MTKYTDKDKNVFLHLFYVIIPFKRQTSYFTWNNMDHKLCEYKGTTIYKYVLLTEHELTSHIRC